MALTPCFMPLNIGSAQTVAGTGSYNLLTLPVDIWTATDDGFVTMCPLLNGVGYNQIKIGDATIPITHNVSNSEDRVFVCGFIKKGEKISIEATGLNIKIREDVTVVFRKLE